MRDAEKVAENRRRVAAWMGVPPQNLLSVYQVHSPDVIVVREAFGHPRPKADAIVTDRPGLAICASAADCGPVLFADAKARVIGAAHAGWKGAFTGVLENTITAMEGLGGRRENIVAVLGPSISQANYEVGPEFVERFTASDPATHAISRCPANLAMRSSISISTPSTASPGPACKRASLAAAPMPKKIFSIPTGAPPTATKPITGG